MSQAQGSSVSLPPSSQSTEGETLVPAPTSQWKVWSRGVNESGAWYCTHKFADDTETYHYVHQNGGVYMKHRDGSATYSPNEGTYIPSKERDPNSKLPPPTMEEIIEESKEAKKEHREYLDRPLKYWNGVCTTLQSHQRRRRPVGISWLFPTCDCCDRYSMYDDDYPDYDYDYEDDYDMVWGEYERSGRNSEEEEDYSDDDDRSSTSSDEREPITKQEDDETTVRITDSAHPSAVEEAETDVKQETEEEICDEPVMGHLPVPKLDQEAAPGLTPDSAPFDSAATGSGIEERTPRDSKIGPNIETEGKRILRSHRSKPY
ncbi:hypothetical protein BDM02DRAFT_3184498 [Thelephora ganbajun]|uniref:Uncharacterized protein n=1 Tax=Thelephora ganbajun TaxID=370292 RepID=A0ACB6ZPP1_THEGA|nr:hypothetical protein BDM02DRAFT_3184498 [Thelephora ganbajun]